MKITKSIFKHLSRLKNTLYRRFTMLLLKCQYGSQFQYKKFHFRRGFCVFVEDQGILKIGTNVFFNNDCSITVREKVTIGNNCIFGENVKIYDHNHKYKDADKLICEQGYSSKEVIINDNCWIGSNVIILKGVNIGKNSVIGAGVIVYKDVPENTVVICKQNNYQIKKNKRL